MRLWDTMQMKFFYIFFLGVGWDWVRLVRRPLIGLLYLQCRWSFSIFFSWGGVRLSPLGTSTTNWPTVPALDDRCWMWSTWWDEHWQGNRSTRRKPASVPLCPPQISHDLTWYRTRATEVGSRRLTAWAMARPQCRWVCHYRRLQCRYNNTLPLWNLRSNIKLFLPWRWRQHVPPKHL
jgi:hypothetical protein